MKSTSIEVSILTAMCNIYLLVTSIATIAFGFDRFMNHHLPIGGVFIVVLGFIGILLSFWELLRLNKKEQQNKDNPTEEE
jgi:Co/Zn/Cd efflux system component